jgi:fructose-bisphosphate aldolase class II
MKLKNYLIKAKKQGFAIGQFNFSTTEQLRAIIIAAIELKSPVIVGLSPGEADFIGLEQAIALVKAWRESKKFPIFINLDHAKEIKKIKRAIELGFDAIHFDGSDLSLKENIKLTKKIKKIAQKKNILIEGEVGKIGKESSKIHKEKLKIKKEDLTDPKEALEFVKKTKVESLAVSIGTFHGIEFTGKNPKIQLERLREIKKTLPENIFLVLHGSSGTRKKDIKQSIKLGMVKINVNTDLRIAFTKALKKNFLKNPDEIIPYRYLKDSVFAVKKIVTEKIKLFGSERKV